MRARSLNIDDHAGPNVHQVVCRVSKERWTTRRTRPLGRRIGRGDAVPVDFRAPTGRTDWRCHSRLRGVRTFASLARSPESDGLQWFAALYVVGESRLDL
jgi:hypothetical protein